MLSQTGGAGDGAQRGLTAQPAPRHPPSAQPHSSAVQELGTGIQGFEPNRFFPIVSLLDGLQGGYEGLHPRFLSADVFLFSLP